MTSPPIPDPDNPITGDELTTLIDAIALDHLGILQSLMSDKRRYDGKTFQHEAALLLTTTLDRLGFCWVRPPQDHDCLYDDILSTLYDIGQVERLGLTSDNASVRKSSARSVALRMMQTWRESKTAVLRRKPAD